MVRVRASGPARLAIWQQRSVALRRGVAFRRVIASQRS